jgi:mannose/cellobiose epimerase-like protein (N-acyl-D-glucosamine 2-epimerase family)
LFDFAYRYGVDEDGGVFDQVDRGGSVLVATKRLWPQTERIKAHVVRGELDLVREALGYCFSHYVDPTHGGWSEHLTRDGQVFSRSMNATSVYHIVMALTEAANALALEEARPG